MVWIFLVLAILFEVAGTTSLKMSEGFARLAPTLMILPFYGVSFAFLVLAVREIPISVAYAIWSGMGTAAIAVIGIGWFREPLTLAKALFLGVIIIGVVGLHLSSAAAKGGSPD